MFAMNDQISERQAMRLITFDLLGYSAIMIPSTLAKDAGRDGIFGIVLGTFGGFLYLLLLRAVLRKMDGNYETYLERSFGVFPGLILRLFYAVFFLFLAGKVAAVFAELVVKELLKKQFRLILGIILVLVFYGITVGIEGRARVYEILFWILLLPLFIMFLCALPTVDADYWTPVFTEKTTAVLNGAYHVFLCFFALCLIPFLAEFVHDKEKLYRSGRNALFLVGTILFVLYLILLGMFGDRALSTIEYPAVTMMSRVQITGGFLKRTDAIMFGIWFFTLFALLCSLLFFGERLLRGLFKRCSQETFCKNAGFWCTVLVTAAVYGLADTFYRNESFSQLFENFFWYVGIPFTVLVPCFLLIRKKGRTAVLLLFCLLLNGCMPTEVEDREFPVALTVSTDTEQFAKEWLDTLVSGNKKVDYNHLKVIIIERKYLEQPEKMSGLLTLLKQEKSVPLNAYVVTTEDADALEKAEEKLDKPLGNYVEELLERSDEIKKETYPTIGMLYQEKENCMETLFIPYLSLVDEKPEVVAYEAYKRGEAEGLFETDTALLSFFVADRMKKYELQLAVNQYVELSNTKNEITFAKEREKSGRVKKQVRVAVCCDGKILYQTYSENEEETKEWLKQQIAEYMTQKTKAALERKIDLTNSRKKLGGSMREWYDYYQTHEKAYEEEIEVVYDVTINWTE